jgi:quercetin dioxygenase-like cupin family protein
MELQSVRPTVKTPAQNFTGDVYMTPIYFGTEPSRMTVALVRFTPGARTNWHRHAVGQTLHVTEGVGLTQSRGGDVVVIRPGDTVWCPPGEWHWHGTAPDHFMTHLAIWDGLAAGEDGPETEWGEQVTDAKYDQTAI